MSFKGYFDIAAAAPKRLLGLYIEDIAIFSFISPNIIIQ